jgi:hypothetical protein
MANTLITPTIIAKEALFQLKNNCVMANLVHRAYEREWQQGVLPGSTVNIRKPVKFVASNGASRTNQDVTESNTSLVVNKQKHVSWNFSSQELSLTIQEYSERYIVPAIIALANQVDTDLTALYVDTYLTAGTDGTAPSTFKNLADVAQLMDEHAVPQEMRCLVLNPAGHWAIADGLKGVFQPTMVEDFLRRAALGRIAGFEIFSDQNIKTHTAGDDSANTPLSNGATQDGASIITDGWAASTLVLEAGDIITFAGTNDVNPISRADLGYLKQFVVTADATSDAGGDLTIAISPSIVFDGKAYDNVTQKVADGSAITVVNNSGASATTHAANLAFHKNAFALAMVPMVMPEGAVWKGQETADGFSIRTIKDYDIANDIEIIRLDILYGVKTIYPDIAVRLRG